MRVVLQCVECQDEGVMSNMSKSEQGRDVNKQASLLSELSSHIAVTDLENTRDAHPLFSFSFFRQTHAN